MRLSTPKPSAGKQCTPLATKELELELLELVLELEELLLEVLLEVLLELVLQRCLWFGWFGRGRACVSHVPANKPGVQDGSSPQTANPNQQLRIA